MMDAAQAKTEITSIFGTYHTLTATDQDRLTSQTPGKLYELWVLSLLVEEIAARGYTIAFQGHELRFKGAPGYLKLSDPHFTINGGALPKDAYRIFVDVEFTTLSATRWPDCSPDRSAHYEADIIVTASLTSRPALHETALIVECKAHANLAKGVIREILGTRRELSLFRRDLFPCPLRTIAPSGPPSCLVPACPPIDLRLATIDPKVERYRQGPSRYGIAIEVKCP